MANLSLDILNETHPDYDVDCIAEHEALYCGGKRWREMVGTWIPQNTHEPLDLWTERKKRATYDNHAGPIVDLIVAWLFSKPPTVQGIDADWLTNVDRKGTSFATWLRQGVTDALKHGKTHALVNLPPRPAEAPTNRADEEAMGLARPFLVDLPAATVRDWGNDEFGSLAFVLARDEVNTRASVGSGRTVTFRWRWIDAQEIRRWEYQPAKDAKERMPKDAVATEAAVVSHRFGRIPVARLDLPDGLRVMAKVRDPAVCLTQLANDLNWSLHRWSNSLLVMGVKEPTVEPVLGAGYYLRTGVEDKVYAVAPDASGFAAMQARIKDAREELYRVVQQMASGISGDSTKQAASAAAKGMDWQQLQVMLAAYADLVKAWAREILMIAAVPLNAAPDTITVGGLEGWQEDELAVILEDVLTAKGIVKSETFEKLLAKSIAARMIPEGTDDETRRKINEEIDAADYSATAGLYEKPPGGEAPGGAPDVADNVEAAGEAIGELLAFPDLPVEAAELAREAAEYIAKARAAVDPEESKDEDADAAA